MKIKILKVFNPIWFDEQHTGIECQITVAEYGDQVLPFLATPSDSEEHGRDLFQKLVAGVYGAIAPYVAAPLSALTATQNSNEAKQLLAQTDWVNQPDVYDPRLTPHLLNRDEFLAYRAVLRALVVSPITGAFDWPLLPHAVWQK